MDFPKFFVSNQKEEFISIQRVEYNQEWEVWRKVQVTIWH